MRTYLSTKGKQVSDAILAGLSKTDEDADARAARLVAQLDLDWTDLPALMRAALEPFILESVGESWDQVGAAQAALSVSIPNDRAVDWALDRSAEMVGMKYVDGDLVQNPNAIWRIDEYERETLRETVSLAIEEGWSNDRLASAIQADNEFSDARAEMIARTETAQADMQGNAIAYKAAQEGGIQLLKRWITAGDDLVSIECQENADAGDIELGETFPSGADWPPEHPNCRCDCAPISLTFNDTEGD